MKIVLGLLAAAGCASSAMADFISVPQNQQMMTATAAPIGEAEIAGTVLYSSIPGPYSAFAVGAFAARDDYTTSTGGTGTFVCDKIRFVGGVAAAGGILDFFFLDSASNVVSSFGVALPSAGDFVWTITLGTTSGLAAAHTGQLQIQSRTGSTGRWFMTTTGPVPGSNSNTSGHGSTLTPTAGYGAFEFQELVPAPGSLALLGLGGLAAARRRR